MGESEKTSRSKINEDNLWTRGAELTARIGLLMHQLQRERGLMTLHVADTSWGAQCFSQCPMVST